MSALVDGSAAFRGRSHQRESDRSPRKVEDQGQGARRNDDTRHDDAVIPLLGKQCEPKTAASGILDLSEAGRENVRDFVRVVHGRHLNFELHDAFSPRAPRDPRLHHCDRARPSEAFCTERTGDGYRLLNTVGGLTIQARAA